MSAFCERDIVKVLWQKLRESHREAIRRQSLQKKSGQGALKNKPWTYQKQMEFLLPFMRNRKTTSNVQSEANEYAKEGGGEVEEPRQAEDQSVAAVENEVDNNFENTESLEIPVKKIRKENAFLETDKISPIGNLPRNKRGRHDPVEQFIKNCEMRAKQRDDARAKIAEENKAHMEKDALYQFFMSMYNTTKQLPASYQSYLKVGFRYYDRVPQRNPTQRCQMQLMERWVGFRYGTRSQ
ncbi:hypothetical protein LSTR_LSTR010785 [Laodelphax striatellus]|uniref:BESS domain-containing protein n=1 Tax=Laodelphax striatellus TaxID=195883 RepID=A0A482X5X6_LAOST|nr:hypothetical protein LSTR_LSTR010785 [Laodelphax striatellus]